MNNKMLKLLALLTTLLLAGLGVEARMQKSAYVGLEEYLNQQRVGPEAIEAVKNHLARSRSYDPVAELVRWVTAGFPDLQDINGIWQTEPHALRLAIVHSIHYYSKTLLPENKSEQYLDIVRGLRNDELISYHLAVTAHLAVDEAVLEREVLELFKRKDPKDRAMGVLMGSTIAEKQRTMFERYVQMLKGDDNAQVRVNILFSISSWHRKEVAYAALDRLVNDSDENVRDWGARCLIVGAKSNLLTLTDLPSILAPMLRTERQFVRLSLGRAAAIITTDRSLHIEEDKITDDLLTGFISRAKLRETRGASPNAEALTSLWLSWWRPLIPAYAKPYGKLMPEGDGNHPTANSIAIKLYGPRAMKGYELYSWKVRGEWNFALVVGTNRLKTRNEVTSSQVRLKDLEAVKKKLEQLPKGAEVFWSTGVVRGTILPPEAIIREVESYCVERGILLRVNRRERPIGSGSRNAAVNLEESGL